MLSRAARSVPREGAYPCEHSEVLLQRAHRCAPIERGSMRINSQRRYRHHISQSHRGGLKQPSASARPAEGDGVRAVQRRAGARGSLRQREQRPSDIPPATGNAAVQAGGEASGSGHSAGQRSTEIAQPRCYGRGGEANAEGGEASDTALQIASRRRPQQRNDSEPKQARGQRRQMSGENESVIPAKQFQFPYRSARRRCRRVLIRRGERRRPTQAVYGVKMRCKRAAYEVMRCSSGSGNDCRYMHAR